MAVISERGGGGNVHDQSRVAPVERDGCRKRQHHRALDRPHIDRASSQAAPVKKRLQPRRYKAF